MIGDVRTNAANYSVMENAIPESVQAVSSIVPEQDTSNIAENTKPVKKYGSIWAWVALLVVYLAYDWFQTRDKVQTAIEPKNIRANAHNIIVMTFGVAIGYNLMQVLLTKLAALKLPLVSKGAGWLLPIFSL